MSSTTRSSRITPPHRLRRAYRIADRGGNGKTRGRVHESAGPWEATSICISAARPRAAAAFRRQLPRLTALKRNRSP
ncbi:MAG: hypothetical protein MZV70_29810 [Desulfobacterales bacterium]|nr:hypothetical protein [Desulfobacterales bacterium]